MTYVIEIAGLRLLQFYLYLVEIIALNIYENV